MCEAVVTPYCSVCKCAGVHVHCVCLDTIGSGVCSYISMSWHISPLLFLLIWVEKKSRSKGIGVAVCHFLTLFRLQSLMCCCSPDTADFSLRCFNLVLTLIRENRGDVKTRGAFSWRRCFCWFCMISGVACVCAWVCLRTICYPAGRVSVFFSASPPLSALPSGVLALSVVLAEQEGENLSGLSNNPDKAIFAVRENGTTCLMVEFAAKFLVPYDVLALNGIDVRNPHWILIHANASAMKEIRLKLSFCFRTSSESNRCA